MKTLADIGEDALIRLLTRNIRLDASVLSGPGDDCAVTKGVPPGHVMLLKTDAVVEGVHFLPTTPAHLVGRKALARVLSDLAAMGGTPCHALVTLMAPATTPVKRVLGLYRGLLGLAEQHGMNVVGGETTRAAQLTLSISAVGAVPRQSYARRSGGKAGDAVLVTGRLGGSIKRKHLTFEPRLKEGQWLLQQHRIHAMMDISDGLAKDLPRLADASGTGFEIQADALPRTPGCTVHQAWGDGEDYELLFALPKKAVPNLLTQWRQTFPRLPLTVIGELVADPRHRKVTGLPELAGGWEPFVRPS